MFFISSMFALSWAMVSGFVAAGLVPLNSDIQVRNAPGISSPDTLLALGRTLSSAAILKRDTVFKNSTTLDTSWNGATLFHYQVKENVGHNTSLNAGIDIVCTTCYVKGTATAQLTIDGNFNFTQAYDNITTQIEGDLKTIISTGENYAENVTSIITHDVEDLDFDFVLPPFDVDLNIDIPEVPESLLTFQFDGLELYMQIDTILSAGATYDLNLYTSKTEFGVSVGDELVGIVFTVDIILSVEADIDISSGFHIQLNDGLAIDIPMFDHNVSSITFTGGNFEFLPVTISSPDIVLTAVLRVGAKVGVEFGTPDSIGDLSFSAGLTAGIWADVAQFVTNVTTNPGGTGSTGSDCELRVVEEYTLLVGANAGATVAFDTHTWGPTPHTQVPLWYTTLANVCAVGGSSTVVGSAAATSSGNGAAATSSGSAATSSKGGFFAGISSLVPRQALTTTTTQTTETYTATGCLSTGLVNCPASLQSISVNKVTKTLTTSVPSGSTASWAATTQNTVSTIAFGNNAHAINPSSGTPTSYVPGPTSGITSIVDGKTGGVSNKIIIGVVVGVGLPLLLASIAACIFCYRQKKYAPVNTSRHNPEVVFADQQGFPTHAFPTTPEPYTPGYESFISKKSPQVNVSEEPWHN